MQIDLSQLDKITNECYYPLFNNRNRYLVIYGGAGSGKSVFVAQKLLVRVMGARKHRILVARKVAKTIRESCFSLLRDMISDWGMSKLFSVNKTDMTITCTNGNQIIFAGLDDVEKLKSIAGITGIWIEEASEVSQDDFEQLDLRLRGNTESYKQVILTFNPISAQHWIKKLFVDDGKPDSHIVKTTYFDNRFIDDEYRQVIEQMQYTNPRYYQIYGKGEWGVFEGQFFNMWDSRIHVCKPFEIPQDWLRFRAMDWGSYHPYSVGWYAVDFDGKLYRYRELYGYGGKPNVGTKETAKEVALKIAAMEKNEQIAYGVLDNACWNSSGTTGPTIAEEINKTLFEKGRPPFRQSEKGREHGAEQFRIRLTGYNDKEGKQIPGLVFFDTCVHAIRTIPMLTHDKHSPEKYDTSGEDHIADEIIYSLLSRPWKPEKPKPEEKKDGWRRDRTEKISWMAY